MASPARALLTDLPKGHEFPATELQVTQDVVAAYVDAVGDDNEIYASAGLAPPLAVAARALGALLELMELPAGTLHTGQELTCTAAVPIGARLTVSGRIAQRSARAGLIISGIELALTIEGDDAPAISAKSTVMSPAEGSALPS